MRIRKRMICNWASDCGESYICNNLKICKFLKCYCKWPFNSSSIGHSICNHTQDFIQNFQALFLQDAYRAIIETARSLCMKMPLQTKLIYLRWAVNMQNCHTWSSTSCCATAVTFSVCHGLVYGECYFLGPYFF